MNTPPFCKNFIIGFFMDTVHEFFFQLCLIITLLRVYQFVPGLMTLTLFQGHMCVRIIRCNFKNFFKSLVHHGLKVVWFLHVYIKKTIHTSMLCRTGVYLRDITNMFFLQFALECESSGVCCSCLMLEICGNLGVSFKH